MVAVLVGTVLILLTGCQSAHQAKLPTQQTVPSSQPRKPISSTAWKAEANRWLGVNYRRGGQNRSGVDCSGLTSQMYLAVAGVALPRTSQDQSHCGNWVSRSDLRPGDLICFISLSERIVEHVGIYLGDTQFVHASPSKGVVVSSLLQDYYSKRYHCARRIVSEGPPRL